MDTMRYGNLGDKKSDVPKNGQIAKKFADGCRKLMQMFQGEMIPESDMRLINYMLDNLVEPSRNRIFIIGEMIEVRPVSKTVVALPSQTRVPLRHKEYQILEAFVFHEGRIIPKEDLYQMVWGVSPTRATIKSLYTTLNGLRQKLLNAVGVSVVSRSNNGCYCLELPVEVICDV